MKERYWQSIPVGKEHAITYSTLCCMWGVEKRAVRSILHELSRYDSGDNYILIRSSSGRGFYRTDNTAEIEAYKRECLSRGRNVFAPIKKINRVLNAQGAMQYSFGNNLRVIREGLGLKQSEVCSEMQKYDSQFNEPLLSKYENGVSLPTPMQCFLLAQIYACETSDLISIDLY